MTLWTPSNLTTAPCEWFKGDVGVTVSGGFVTDWDQQGTNTGGLTDLLGTNPTPGTLNSLRTVSFNGSNQGLATLSTPRTYAAGAMTMFVLALRTAGRGDTYDCLVNTDVPWDTDNGFCLQYDVGDASAPFSAYGGNGYGGNAPYAQTDSPVGGQDGNWHVLEVGFGTTTYIYFDGNSQTISGSAGAFPLMEDYNFDVGFNPDGNYFGGSIAEVILLNYAPTTGERQQVEGYLAWKWGNTGTTATDLVAKLPSGHPYKSSAPTTGPTPINGSASISEAADTVSSVGALKIQATASINDASDGLSTAGKLLINATASLTESTDTVSSTGMLPSDTGSAAITEEPDFSTSAGSLLIAGTASIPEAADTVSSTGLLALNGSASIAEAADTLSASGIGPGRQGTASITEANDTVASAAKVIIAGTASITEADDTSTSLGSLKITATASITEEADTIFVSNGKLSINGTGNITEANDTMSSVAAHVIQGTANIQEADDTVAAVGGGTVVVNATGLDISIFEGFPGFKYGWVQPAIGTLITTSSGHIDSRSWVASVPGTAIWVKVNA